MSPTRPISEIFTFFARAAPTSSKFAAMFFQISSSYIASEKPKLMPTDSRHFVYVRTGF
jgi:hypothetical protein